jgi:hypothetical protein
VAIRPSQREEGSSRWQVTSNDEETTHGVSVPKTHPPSSRDAQCPPAVPAVRPSVRVRPSLRTRSRSSGAESRAGRITVSGEPLRTADSTPLGLLDPMAAGRDERPGGATRRPRGGRWRLRWPVPLGRPR